MKRISHLNNHLDKLAALNASGQLTGEIQTVIKEIEKELGLASQKTLSSYSTTELQEELLRRTGVYEITANQSQEAIVTIVTGEEDKNTSYNGPVKIYVCQD